jgi:hypothetical protein
MRCVFMIFRMSLQFILKNIMLLVCAFSGLTHADSNWNFDIGVDRQHQTFGQSTSDLTTVSFDPSFQSDNWLFSLSAPWYKTQGDYYLNGVRPRLITRCERLSSLSPARQAILIAKGKVTQKLINRCERLVDVKTRLDESQQGIGDITGFVNYSLPLVDDSSWSAIFGLGYKSDTGDVDSQLGSGTKDGLVEGGLSYGSDKASFGITLGYDFVSDGEKISGVYEPQNYAYAHFNGAYNLGDWVSIGFVASSQKAYVVGGHDVKSVTEYVTFSAGDHVSFKIYTVQFSGEESPDKEIGASLSCSF